MSHKVLLFSPTLLWESSWPHLVVPYTEEPISQPFVGKNGFLFVLQKRTRFSRPNRDIEENSPPGGNSHPLPQFSTLEGGISPPPSWINHYRGGEIPPPKKEEDILPERRWFSNYYPPTTKIHDFLQYWGSFHNLQENIYFGRQMPKCETLRGLTKF